MIAPMKKQAFMVFHGDYHDFIEQLGQLGVLHVIEREEHRKEESLADIRSRIERIEHISVLIARARDEIEPSAEEVDQKSALGLDTFEIMEEIEHASARQEALAASIDEIRNLIEKQEPWGDYSEEDLRQLEASGYRAYLFRSLLRTYDIAWEEEYSIFEIHRNATHKWFILFAPSDRDVNIDAEREMPARQSLSELRESLHLKEQEQAGITRSLAAMDAAYGKRLANEKKRMESELALQEVYLDTHYETDDAIRILEGWVPEKHAEEVKALAEETGAVTIEIPPGEGEIPPVQLHNSRFSRLFEPISKMFDLPNYSELDLTPYFAPFFMIFFGFCLGDAGYGIVFILLGLLLKLKLKRGHKMRPMLTLAQYFGVATIVFGLLSGTFFGMNLIDSGYTLTAESLKKLESSGVPEELVLQLQRLEGEYFRSRSGFMTAMQEASGNAASYYGKELIRSAEAGIPFVREFRHLMQDSLSMFYLAILIGALQIVFGIFVRILNITRRKGFKYALSPVGWLILILTLVLYAAGLFNGELLKWAFYGLLGVSGLLIMLLNKPGAGIFARIGGGVWDAYNMVTGLFGDLLSYIRLFALGISSAILGFVFNDISLQLLNIPWIGWLFFLVILLAGHSINLFLATLGGFIHPMRLTFVEFYKNAGFEGGGKEYKPFTIN
jgi:V/A-type H+-transporting ATPase subunit I